MAPPPQSRTTTPPPPRLGQGPSLVGNEQIVFG